MSHENKIVELKEKELEKVSGGVTPEQIYGNQEYVIPNVYAILGDGQLLSITYGLGKLFDSNGKEFRLTSFSNSEDGLSTTYFFISMDQSEQYVKEVRQGDNVISYFRVSPLWIIPDL